MDAKVQKAYDEEQQIRRDNRTPRFQRTWKKGQLVLVRNQSKQNSRERQQKLAPRWLGPYRIRQVFDGSVSLSSADGEPVFKRQKVAFELLESWYSLSERWEDEERRLAAEKAKKGDDERLGGR